MADDDHEIDPVSRGEYEVCLVCGKKLITDLPQEGQPRPYEHEEDGS